MPFVLTLVLASLLVILAIAIQKWRHNYWSRQGAPQLPPNLLFGNLTPMVTGKTSLFDFFKDLYFTGKKAGHKFLGIYNLWAPEIVIIDRDLMKTILTKDFPYISSHGIFHHKSNPITMHMFNMDGQEWKDRRTKMTPLFTTGKLKTMFTTLTDKSNSLSKFLGKCADESKPANIKDVFARFTTDNITNIAFGLNTDNFSEEDSFFRKLGEEFSAPDPIKVLLENLFPDNLLGNLGYQAFNVNSTRIFIKIIKDIIKYREHNSVKRNDLMDMMLQLKKNGSVKLENGNILKEKLFMDDDEIISESFLFFFAGFDTSSSTTTFAIWELAQHQELQDKAREEINEVLEKYNGELNYESLAEMTYLDQIIKETLRLYPIVPILPRMCTKDYKIPDTNIMIRKGFKVNIPICGLQRDPEYFDNPDDFNPENFSPEKEAQRPEYTWMPFGSGPRQCLGLRLGLMQSKIGVLTALRKFRFTPHKSEKQPKDFSAGTFLLYFKKDPIVNVSRV